MLSWTQRKREVIALPAFCDALKQARLRAGLTQLQVARSLGVTASTYCGYETGKREPDVPKLRRLALLLHLSGDELLCLPHAAPPVSAQELELVRQLRSLDEHGHRVVRLVLDEELSRSRSEKLLDSVPFRVSEQPAAAGLGAYLGAEAFKTVLVRRNALPRGASFGVPVQGDSMEPKYRDGDVLIVSDLTPEPGDVGVFIMEGAGYVKVMGSGELLSLNPAYAPIPMTEGIRSCGKVIGVLNKRDLLL